MNVTVVIPADKVQFAQVLMNIGLTAFETAQKVAPVPIPHKDESLAEIKQLIANLDQKLSGDSDVAQLIASLDQKLSGNPDVAQLIASLDQKLSGNPDVTHLVAALDQRISGTSSQNLDRLGTVIAKLDLLESKVATPVPVLPSAKIGAQAELTMEEHLHRALPGFDVRAPGAAHAGDLVIHSGGKSIMIEVKKYSRNVPAGEMTKFFNDLNNPANSFSAGIMIAVDSGIVGRGACEYVPGSAGSRPAIVLSQCASDSAIIGVAVRFLLSILRENVVVSDASAEPRIKLIMTKLASLKTLEESDKSLKRIMDYNSRELGKIKQSIRECVDQVTELLAM